MEFTRHGFVSWQECFVTFWVIFLNVALRTQTAGKKRDVYKCLLLPFRPITCIFPHSHWDCGVCSIGFNSCSHEGLSCCFLSLWKVYVWSVLDWDEVQCLEKNLYIQWKLSALRRQSKISSSSLAYLKILKEGQKMAPEKATNPTANITVKKPNVLAKKHWDVNLNEV